MNTSELLKNKKAQGGGIGTLIIFIAIVLVAAIASYVLLGTGGTLQNRALLVGKESTTRVSTQLIVESVYGEANTTSASAHRGMKYLISIVKLSAGSDPIDVTELNLHYATDDELISNIFTNTTYADSKTLSETINEADYSFNEITGNGDNLIESGESFELYFYVENEDGDLRHTPENTEFIMTYRPKAGTETEVRSKIPSQITKTFTRLYP